MPIQWRQSAAGIVFLLAAVTACGCRPASQRNGKAELTTVAQVRKLSPESAIAGVPVHLRGIVTLSERAGAPLTIQDETGGISIAAAGNRFRADAGQLVEVRGFTGQGGNALVILGSEIHDQGRGRLPQPVPVTVRQLERGEKEYETVEIRDVARAIETGQGGRHEMDLVSEGRHVRIPIQFFAGADAGLLIDAKVRVRGVPAGSFDAEKHPLHLRVWTPSLATIFIEEPAPADPYASTPISLRRLELLSPEQASGHRFKVKATIIPAKEGILNVRDATGDAFVEASSSEGFHPGDRVEIAGFAPPEGGSARLEQAIVRRIDPPAGATSQELRLLTSVAALRKTSLEEARLAPPVLLRGVVTFFDPAWVLLFIQDKSGGVFVNLQGR